MTEKANKTEVPGPKRKNVEKSPTSMTTLKKDREGLDIHWMKLALKQAELAGQQGEIPVGAVLVDSEGKLLALAGNSPIILHDPTAHAEIMVIRKAAEQLQNYRLPGTTLYVTLEPCLMCMGALIHARIGRLVFGATDAKTGAARSVYNIGDDNKLNHSLEITGGVLQLECSLILKNFFKTRRKGKTALNRIDYLE